jgi:hypothetical protein
MIIENTAAFQFFMNEDIYLVKKDMDNLDRIVAQPAAVIEEPVVRVEIPAIPAPPLPVVTQAPALAFEYAGKNQKQFLILCHYPGTDSMDDKHLEALKSALQRKELTLDDVAILNIAKYANTMAADLHEYFKPQRLLILGEPCLLNSWDKFALNQLENLGGIKALYTYSFAEMMGDRDKTKAFWEQMKVL